jgi:hypothetical protein
MARQSAILIPTSTQGTGAGPSDWVISLTGQSSVIKLGANAIFVINCTSAVNISFGNSAGSVLAPTATNCYQIPASQQTTFDLGQANDSIQLFTTSAGVVYIKVLSVV